RAVKRKFYALFGALGKDGSSQERPHMLSVRQVTKEFGGIRAVDACCFEVERASITGLIGPNGAGKTTLFNIISSFLRPDQGEVWFDGPLIDHLTPHRIARLRLDRTLLMPREAKAMPVLEYLMLVAWDQRGERIWNGWFFRSKVGEEEE